MTMMTTVAMVWMMMEMKKTAITKMMVMITNYDGTDMKDNYGGDNDNIRGGCTIIFYDCLSLKRESDH